MRGHLEGDPTSFDGAFLAFPLTDDARETAKKAKKPEDNATTGATAAGARALTARLIAFYFRAPAKAFLRGRVE